MKTRRLVAGGCAGLLLACTGDSPVGPAIAGCEYVAADALELPPPTTLLAARRQRLASSIENGVAVFASGSANPDPQNEGLRGDSNLFYLAGLDVQGSWLVLLVRNGQVDSTLLFLPAITPAEGVPAQQVTGASRVRCTSNFSETLQRLLSSDLPLYLHQENAAAQDPAVQAVRSSMGATTLELRDALTALRMVKDSAEIARLRQAADITARSIAGAVHVIAPGRGEADVASAIGSGFRELGATGPSFPSIIASGRNALTLHYNTNQRSFAGDELVLIDVGAEYARYAGDVTRTFPVNGRFSARQRELYELVLGALQAATAAVRPGVTMLQLDGVARDYFANHSGSRCGTQSCAVYFGHSLTHSLGLNVHDPASYHTPLQPGAVITVEPGLYLADEGIGIRIEDDVLVTANGHEVLSSAVPTTVAEIEALGAARSGGTAAQFPSGSGILNHVP